VKIEKNKDKRCPIGVNGSQEETVDDILINIVDVTEDKSSVDPQVYDQDNPCNNLYPSDKA